MQTPSTRRTAHLVYGPTAAGKSTFARRLAGETNAVRFTIDDWMHALFGPDRPGRLEMGWVMERVARCRALMWETGAAVLASGRDVVFEIGLMREADRAAMRARVEAAGHAATFHFVDAPRALRLERALRRNEDQGATYSFEVTPAMFDAMEPLFEPPTARERDHAVVANAAQTSPGSAAARNATATIDTTGATDA